MRIHPYTPTSTSPHYITPLPPTMPTLQAPLPYTGPHHRTPLSPTILATPPHMSTPQVHTTEHHYHLQCLHTISLAELTCSSSRFDLNQSGEFTAKIQEGVTRLQKAIYVYERSLPLFQVSESNSKARSTLYNGFDLMYSPLFRRLICILNVLMISLFMHKYI